ncbi:DUF5753 domain-containing protein [Pseudonocardia sp. NPDC046786]|uniref:DUF5753 domain-containing protein n=1 Tax=Pseudonocardia sp. NPDC046786 TaxID=3155471 RepID=UPI0033EAEDBF
MDVRAGLPVEPSRELADLVASLRSIDAMYLEWRRTLGTGTRRRQPASLKREGDARLLRWYEPVLVPGLLQTAEYAEAVLRQVIEFYGVPDDVAGGVATRMQRQQVLYRGGRRFVFVLAEQALRTTVGDDDVMAGQLDRLLTVMSTARVVVGIVPASAPYRVPTNQFILFDDRTVNVETVSAELTITQPREIALYAAAFEQIWAQATTGDAARTLIRSALQQRNPT